MTPPEGEQYSYTYQSKLLVDWFRALADALIAHSVDERVICALEALYGGHGLSSRYSLDGEAVVRYGAIVDGGEGGLRELFRGPVGC